MTYTCNKLLETKQPLNTVYSTHLAPEGQERPKMGFVTAAADAVVALLSLTMAVAAPLFDAQVVLPRGLYAAPLVGIHRWFAAEFGHYLVADPPPFFRGLVWLDLAFLWPVCVANLYGILARRPWSAATSIMAGVYVLTYMVTNSLDCFLAFLDRSG